MADDMSSFMSLLISREQRGHYNADKYIVRFYSGMWDVHALILQMVYCYIFVAGC